MTARPKKKYVFTVHAKKYAVSLTKQNYAALDTLLGLSADDTIDDSVQLVTVSEAVVDIGVMAPIKLKLQNGTKTRQAFVFVPLPKIEEAMHPTSGLKGKRYGTWTIKDCWFEMDRIYVP